MGVHGCFYDSASLVANKFAEIQANCQQTAGIVYICWRQENRWRETL
jgi:hypothetical protein